MTTQNSSGFHNVGDSTWTWIVHDTPCDSCGATIPAGTTATRLHDGDILCWDCTTW